MQQPQRSERTYLATGLAFGLAANDPSALRNWVVDIRRADGTTRTEVIGAPESWDAIDAADAMEPDNLRRDVRPLVELTEREGRARWPNPLHLRASAEADAGWTARAAHEATRDAYAERNSREALRLQIQQNPQQWGLA